jgi:hypothetical protein
VEDEHHVEVALRGVGHEALKLGAGLRFAPPGVEVAILSHQFQVILDGELADRLALGVGRESLALLFG